MQIWKRFSNITGYLEHDSSLIAALVLTAVEQYRLNSLEIMLASNILSDAELSAIQQSLQESAEKMPQINRNALYYEAVFGNDTACGWANGTLFDNQEDSGSEGIKHYRFLLPGVWYLANCNYRNLLTCYNAENLCKVQAPTDSSLKNLLPQMMLPATDTAGKRMHEMTMRYQAFIALIEAEKIKRKSGKYPEKLPLDIIDFFSGEPLKYNIGSHEIPEAYLTLKENAHEDIGLFGKYTITYRPKTVQGVAVWSIGKNKIDENGYNGFAIPGNGKAADDQRALLIISR